MAGIRRSTEDASPVKRAKTSEGLRCEICGEIHLEADGGVGGYNDGLTVAELFSELRRFPPDAKVRMYCDPLWGYPAFSVVRVEDGEGYVDHIAALPTSPPRFIPEVFIVGAAGRDDDDD